MAELTMYTCDVCGRTKGEANHWLLASVSNRDSVTVIAFVGWGFQGYLGTTGKTLHLCGLECATKAMHKAMSE